jgi:methionyl-tRNA formyltransferase
VAEKRLRVVLCTSGGLHGAVVLDRLLATARIEVAGIVLSSRVLGPDDGVIGGALAYIRRCGLRYATYLGISTFVADLLRRSSRRAIAVRTTRRVNDDESRAFIAECSPDLLVAAFFNQRIDARTARLARLAAVNIHPSALPDFRGVDPVFYALLRGAPALGATVHRISPEWDAGEVLRQEVLPRQERESVLAATARLYGRGAELLAGALDDIESGAPGAAQRGEGCYDSWPSRTDVAALGRHGVALVRASDLWSMTRRVESAR